MPALVTREQAPLEQTWNLGDIYATPEDWAADARRLDEDNATVSSYQGRLGEGAATLLACLRARDTLNERLQRLASYARLNASADGSSARNQGMAATAAALDAAADAALSFIATELLALPEGAVEGYLRDESDLETYRPLLVNVLRRRAHMLAPAAEEAVAALGEVLDAPYMVYQRATAVDMACPPIQDTSGQVLPVSIARYVFGLAQSPDRETRRRAYESLAHGLDGNKASLATTLAAYVTRNVTLARLRHYASATEMILDGQRVPLAVYTNVLDVVHDEIAPHMRRLLRLRQRVLGLDRLYRYDLEAPLDPGYDPPVTFEESERLIREGLRGLGAQYGAMLGAAFRDRWIDRADNAGKGSGAFCAPVYGVHPYVFTTWQDQMRNAFVLAHELGHAGHMLRSARAQSVSNAMENFESIKFFIEAPSTANELLLGHHLLDTTDDPRLRRWIILQLLGTFTHNMVTHLLEAHFERRLYALAEAGQPLTAAAIMDVQGAVFERFFDGTVVTDEAARLYWLQQPHFYLGGLYPYTYSAGLSCAYGVTEAIRAEGQPAVDRWLATLALGTTLPAVELARRAGVDMTTPEPIRRAVGFFSTLVDELERSFV
jgi:oligoendopeptidase F